MGIILDLEMFSIGSTFFYAVCYKAVTKYAGFYSSFSSFVGLHSVSKIYCHRSINMSNIHIQTTFPSPFA